MMRILENELAENKVALTVYSPDTYYSNLITDIDRFISSNTSLVPVYRQWVKHTPSSIERFYQPVIHKNLPKWHLVCKLFTAGPSLLTFWHGANALEILSTLKGKSHPKLAMEGSIRSQFWCDNSVCNLIHVSDNNDELIRELKAINSIPLLKMKLDNPLNVFNLSKGNYNEISHNGIYVFSKFIYKLLTVKYNLKLNNPEITCCGKATKNYENLLAYLNKVSEIAPEEVNLLIKMFLAGDKDIACLLEKYNELSEWEKFIIECTAASQEKWNNRGDLHSVITKIADMLKDFKEWLFCGSTAMRLYGYLCFPNDIDIVCSKSTLEQISSYINEPVKIKEASFGKYFYIDYKIDNWDIEFSTIAEYNSGCSMKIDAMMMQKAGKIIPLMPLEDMIVELFAMSRKAPKDDIKRAKLLYQKFYKTFDIEYLKNRIKSSNIEYETIYSELALS